MLSINLPSSCSCYVFSQWFAYFFLVKRVKRFAIFLLTTKTAQPRPQVFSVNGSIIWQFYCTYWRHFSHIAKFLQIWGAIHSTKISRNFGPKLNGSVRSNRKSFEKTGPPFEVDHFSRSDRLEFWLNGSRPWSTIAVYDELCVGF